VFLHDDRAPHGLVLVCKRWYQREMARYLMNAKVFEDCPNLTWNEVVASAKEFNQPRGYVTGSGIVYNYGIWKSKKQNFRFIAGTRSCSPGEKFTLIPHSGRALGPPRQPLYEAHKALVRMLQHIEIVLKQKDQIRQRQEGIHAFWGIDSVSAFTRLVRSHADVIVQQDQYTADFCTMYTSFDFNLMISRTLQAAEEAWHYHHQQQRLEMDLALDLSVDELVLGVAGWSYGEGGLSPCQLAEFITYLIYNNYTFNGGKVKRQIMGMPMGMPAAPQIANLACYPVEREHSYVLGPGKSMTVCRYIDDFYASGVPLPPKEAYGMDYVVTASGALLCILE